MNTDAIQECDQILCYTLTRKIGSGGYGDVWEADAPGGLKKAIKIVHGFHGEKRAQSELKSLERIKDARHPFLLSLERIEIHNSKLVVVSELADKSLADLAQEYVDQGAPGIPRDELIRYMQESADALDYLNAKFGLQHLDIKPENILLVSGHAKVADFGLVKDLREVTQSVMSGMTPAYAPPEMFDGRPGHASDQYSLAMVYQEMLTMVRPFTGSTPAQLAAQHMHGKPNLQPLPISDQPVIAKALSKAPDDRYKTCVQFVEQLANRKTRKKVVRGRVSVRENVDSASNTVEVDSTDLAQGRSGNPSTKKLAFKSVDSVLLNPPECDPESARFQPTIVIGLGNSASQVIRKVKQRIVARYGSLEPVPSFSLLCIDSDREALTKLSQDRDASSISAGETLAVPLRRSEQYRQHKTLDLSWISRRWIYNVPRNLQTDGLRPLGRLVFADHFEMICNRISERIKQAIRTESIANTCETLGLNPPQQVVPRVILVSNISGGIGSGMTIDLAYTIRLMLAENGINENETIGILMHGNKAGREANLAAANAYAFMCELRHFADGGYPGDRRLELPDFEDQLPFDHTYGLKLNAEHENQPVSDLDRIAEYICLSNTTRCNVFFDASRQTDKDNEEFSLRSFGVSICGPGLQLQGKDAVERLAKGLIDQWIAETDPDDLAMEQFAESCATELGLRLDEITTRAMVALSEMQEWPPIDQQIRTASTELSDPGSPISCPVIEAHFDAIFDAPYWRSQSQGDSTELCRYAEAEISSEAQLIGDQLATKILQLLSGKKIRFPLAKQALKACQNLIAVEHSSVMKELHSFGSTMLDLQQLFEGQDKKSSKGRVNPAFLTEFVNRYGQLRVQEFTLRCCHKFYRIIKSCLTSTEEIIKKFSLQIAAVGQQFEVVPEPKRTSKLKPTIQQMLVDSVDQNREKQIQQIEAVVLESIVNQDTAFLDVLSDSANWQQKLPAVIREAAQSVLSNAFKNISIDEVIARNGIEPAAVRYWLKGQLNDAVPFVKDCGGGTMLLLGQPRHAGQSILPTLVADCFDVQLKEINGTTGDLVLCFEAEGIRLANFAFSILKEAPEAMEIARRIHSRDDIDWTTLTDLM